MSKEVYLGDGLYASFDGWHIILRAPREDGDHIVALEPLVLNAFDKYRENLKMSEEEMDLRGYPAKKIACHKCGSRQQLLVQESRCGDTGKLIEKNFICAQCAWGIERECK